MPAAVGDLAAIVEAIRSLARPDRRVMVAIAGPPGAGKSWLAAKACALLNEHDALAAVVPMDAFHFDNEILRSRGLLSRKGAPSTFDVNGFKNILVRLRTDTEVCIPLFDRTLDLSRGSAFCIEAGHRILVVEGNYILLDLKPWVSLRPLFDLKIAIDVPRPLLVQRLTERWAAHGYSLAAARRRAHDNDLVNADLVAARSVEPDLIFQTTNLD